MNTNFDYIKTIKKANKAIARLIKCDEERWVKQRQKLQQLLMFHLTLLEVFKMKNTDFHTLQYLHTIKEWRYLNLNLEENMNDSRYGKDIVGAMQDVSVHMMAQVLTPIIQRNPHSMK